MKLLYVNEHLSCYNYSIGEKSLADIVYLKKGEVVNLCPDVHLIVFIIKGNSTFSYGSHSNVLAPQNSIVIHPANLNCEVVVNEDLTLVAIRMLTEMSFCDHFSLEMLMRDNDEKSREDDETYIHLLHMNDVIESYLKLLVKYLNDGLRCSYLLEMKIKELLYLLRAYYPKKELKAFFKPILNNDLAFAMRIHEIYRPNLTVKELAEMTNYSPSGFEKKFKKVFNTSANKWLQNKMAQSIYHDINCSTKTFSELAYEYHFSSPAHFNTFCKKQFNITPGGLRRRNQIED
ncbi:AraC family transcriptional regulator [Bacteroidales bacterium OttesenSCG-928-L14]|nr:AraC family transcriptional regulator [Bacteroidales bacterium OttesenSCG-928-L14]